MAPPSKYDWETIERYVRTTGKVDYQELEKLFGVPSNSLRGRAKKYKWKLALAQNAVRVEAEPRASAIEEVRRSISLQDSAWGRIDKSAGRICEALLRHVSLNVTRSIDQNGNEIPLAPADLQKLVQATQSIVMLARSVKGDIGCALDTFTEAGLLPEDYAPQLAEVLDRTEQTLKEGVQNVFLGRMPD